MKILGVCNTNQELSNPQEQFEPQFVQLNRAFSKEQLNLLNNILTFSDTNQEKVLVVGYLPIYSEASDTTEMPWQSFDLMAV